MNIKNANIDHALPESTPVGPKSELNKDAIPAEAKDTTPKSEFDGLPKFKPATVTPVLTEDVPDVECPHKGWIIDADGDQLRWSKVVTVRVERRENCYVTSAVTDRLVVVLGRFKFRGTAELYREKVFAAMAES